MSARLNVVLKKLKRNDPDIQEIVEVTHDNTEWTRFMNNHPYKDIVVIPSASTGIVKYVNSGKGYALVRDYIYESTHLYKIGG